MFKQTLLFFLAFSLITSINIASAKTRHCNANYIWETTGGNVGPVSFEGFSARGHCDVNANECRKKARASILRCARANWELRWEYHPINSDGSSDSSYNREIPDACLNSSHVEGYNLTQEIEGTTVSENGDIKSRLEAEVCCIYRDGTREYSNNDAVHVRLLIQAWTGNFDNKHCKAREVLSSNYKINCDRVRAKFCSR